MNERTKHIVYEQRKAVLRMMNLSPHLNTKKGFVKSQKN